MTLEKIDIKEFKKKIYAEYKKMFPKEERKSYAKLKKTYYKNLTNIIKITSENQIIGFFIVNFLKNSPYLLLDYFAIFPEYQNKGYGTTAIKLLKEKYIKYDGIFIEIENLEATEDKEEKEIRKRRTRFYENLGFCKMGFDLELYGVLYSPYILPCKKDTFSDTEVKNEIFEIYIAVLGKYGAKKRCKVINKT